MIRFNRTRLVGIACLLIFIYFLVFSDSAATSDIRTRTEAALSRKRGGVLRGDLSDQELTDQTNKKLEKILASDKHPENVDSKHERAHHPVKSDEDIEVISIAGRKSIFKTEDTERTKHNVQEKEEKPLRISTTDDSAIEEKPNSSNDPARDIANEKLQVYLKAPMVIFSKTFCPHSRRAKELLLKKYTIDPKPVVVELDQLGEKLPLPPPPISDDDDNSEEKEHKIIPQPVTLGRKIQDLLGEITQRKTVPNIIVGGLHSIGGNDNIWDLHSQGLLGAEIKKYGGNRIVSVELNDDEDHEGKD